MRVIDTGYRNDVWELAFSPDGRFLAAAQPYRGLVIHTLSGGPAVEIDPLSFPGRTVVGFEPGGGALAALTHDGRTRFDVATGTRLDSVPAAGGTPGRVISFDTSAAGDRMATVVFQLTHRLRRALLVGQVSVGGSWRRVWDTEVGFTSDPTFSPAGDRVAVVATANRQSVDGYRLMIHETETGQFVGTGAYPYAFPGRPRFRPDGRQLVAAYDQNLVVWDARRLGKPVLVRNDSRKHFTAAAYHPSGRYLFTTSNDATVTVWDTDSWVRVRRFDWDIGRLRSVAVSPDGLLAAAGSDRGRVVVWDVDV